jgi:selenocysteine-specific elongation factor
MLRALGEVDDAAALRAALALPPFLLSAPRLARDWALSEAELAQPGLLRAGEFLLAPQVLARLQQDVAQALADFHAKQPSAPGMAQEALRLALPSRLPRDAFAALAELLVQRGTIAREAHWLRMPTHHAGLGTEDAKLWQRIHAVLGEQPFRTPRVSDMAKALKLPDALLRRAAKRFAAAGRLTEVAPDQFFLREAIPRMAQIAQQLSVETNGAFTAAQFRDRLGNGRALAILVLEYFDRRGLTLRKGDLRRVVKDPAAVFGTPDNPR